MENILTGIVMLLIGIIIPFFADGDATASLLFIPIGIYFLIGEKKERNDTNEN